MREGMGMAISLGGIVLLNAIGPECSTDSLQQPLAFLLLPKCKQLGIAVYLVRRRGGRLLNIPSGFYPAFARTGSNAFSSSGISQ